VKARAPSAAVVGVEPEGFDDARQSLAAGERITLKPTRRSLCDALESPSTGLITFPMLQRLVSEIAVVSDAEVAEAMRYAFATLKLVVEPGGSVALAALLAGKIKPQGAVGLVLSGGNVDPDLFARVIRGEL
jgi:threonine dehydratase